MRYTILWGVNLLSFLFVSQRNEKGLGGIQQQISFIVSKSHVREMLAQRRMIFLWLKKIHFQTTTEELPVWYAMFEILNYHNKSISQAELVDFKMQFQKSNHSRFKCWCAGFLLLNNQWIRLIPTFHMLCHYPSPLSVVASRDSSGQKS